MGVIALHRKLNKLIPEIPRLVEETLRPLLGEMKQLQLDQLYAGLKPDGTYLIKYTDDTFFKSRDAALRYAKFKEGKNPRVGNLLFGKKPTDVANYIITGELFYDTVYVRLTKEKLIIDAASRVYSNIVSKNGEVLGYTQEAVDYLETLIKPELYKKIIEFLKQA